jgi:type I restriction enzyme M protein
MKTEKKIRSKVIEMDVIEAVIGLGPNLFYGTGLGACIVVARHQKPTERKGRILLIDGSDLFRKGRNQNTLEPEHAAELLGIYRAFGEAEDRARVVTLGEVGAQVGNLNLASYITPLGAEVIPTVVTATLDLREALATAWAAEDRLNELLMDRALP